MKVLYIANSTSLSGGDNKSLRTLLRGVRQHGIEPVVVTPDRKGLHEQLKNEGICVYAVSYRMDVYPDFVTIKDKILFLPRLFARRILEYLAVRKIASICKNANIDIVHSNVSVLSCGLEAARRCSIPHVGHVREFVDIDFHLHPYPTMNAFRNRLQNSGSYLICITRCVQEHFGLSGNRVEQIYNGITFETSVSETSIAKENFFLYAGRIEPAKGVMQLVEAYSAFNEKHKKGPSLLLAGDTNDIVYYSKLKDFIHLHQLEDKIRILGPRKDIASLMKKALATIVPSVFEAFGRCLPEAMINDCLTIGHDTGGTKEQYDNGLSECGEEIGLRYSTSEELVSRLEEVYINAHTEKYTKMRQMAKSIVEKLYSPTQYVDRVCRLYNRIMNDHQIT